MSLNRIAVAAARLNEMGREAEFADAEKAFAVLNSAVSDFKEFLVSNRW